MIDSRKKAAVLFSGGKDSTFAAARARDLGYEITCLLTIFSDNEESYMLHTANIELSALCANAMGIPQFTSRTAGRKEEEVLDIGNAIEMSKKEFGFEYIFTGAIASSYQKDRIEKVATASNVTVVSPLWGINQEEYLRDLAIKKFSYILTSISAEGLDETWLGRKIGNAEVQTIIALSRRFHFNPAFEGGEAETLVTDCPMFIDSEIKIVESEIEWNGYSGLLRVKKAILQQKG